MRELFRRIFNDHRWFIGFVIVIGVVAFFFWRVIDPIGSAERINNFLEGVLTLFKFCLTLVIIFFGIRLMFGWRPFRNRNQRH